MKKSQTVRDPLLQPLKVGGLTIRNRIMSTSHAIGFGVDYQPQERYQLYHEEKAKGGIGLTMFGGSTNVSPDSGSVFEQLYAGGDEAIGWFRQMADRVHRHGAAIMCQLTHLGGRSHWRADKWLPTVAPSRYREPAHRGFTKEMDRHDIDRIVKDFGDAAIRCQEAGLDGCEVHVPGHLVGEFWDPAMNRRSDEFGGSLENRARFGFMVFEEIRRRVRPGFVVGIRMAIGEGPGGAIPAEEYLELARMHDRSGLIDYLNLTYGRIDTDIGLANYMPPMHVPLSPFLRHIAAVNGAFESPVFHAGRINDIATARHAVRENILQMVAMTRGHIADPHIAAKIARGEEDRIRPCVGATYCSWMQSCIHNVSIGREAVLPHRIEKSETRRNVLIVGAGPAGLEAARICAERGHEVEIHEAAPRPGGHLLLAAKAPARKDLIGIVDWRLNELEKLGVAIRTNSFVDEAALAATDADVAIIATGGLPDSLEGEIEGAELAESSWTLLEKPETPSGHVMFYDGTGLISGAAVAEMLAVAGVDLSYVSPDRHMAMETTSMERPFVLEELYRAGARLLPDRQMKAIRRKGNQLEVTLENAYTYQAETITCDRVYIEHGTLPVDDLYFSARPASRNDGLIELRSFAAGNHKPPVERAGGRFDLYRIGDAVSSRDAHAAFLDAMRLCRTL
ncbi:MAG: FAD-dependent oxidoreductase [Pikeienuella sp.]